MRNPFDGKMQKNPSENHEKIMHGLWRANGLGAGRTAGDTGPGAPVVLNQCSKRWFFEKPNKVTIGERSE